MEAVRTVLPVFLVIGIGILCRSRNLISREGINSLKNVAVNICLPAVLFKAFAGTQYGIRDIVIPLAMFLVCVLGYLLGKGCARLFRMSSRHPRGRTARCDRAVPGACPLRGQLYP